MLLKRFPIPSFFFPVAAFILWNLLFFSYLPILRIDLDFSRQLVMADLYFSNIILILAWFLCGRAVFTVFAVFFMILVSYLMLSLGEWGIGVQHLTIMFLSLWLKRITDRIENEKIDRMMRRDKLQEKLNLSMKTLEGKEHLLSALRRKLDRLHYMRQFSDHLKSSEGLEDAGRIVTEEVAGLFPESDEVLLYVCDEHTQELGLVARVSGREVESQPERTGNLYDQWVIKRYQPLLIEDTRSDFRFMGQADVASVYRSLCLVPLISKSAVCGVLRLCASRPGVFHTDDLRLLNIAADLSAVVVRNILLYEKTKELSIMDSLTECFLLRYVRERLKEEVQRSLRNDIRFSIIMADIDYFKKYNDELGHTAGDAVLMTVAGIIRDAVGPSDIVGRYGGEEFIVLMPQKDLEEAVRTAEAIRQTVAAHEFELRREVRRITVSLGVAQFPGDGRDPEVLIGAADSRLYEAKRKGRDRVISA